MSPKQTGEPTRLDPPVLRRTGLPGVAVAMSGGVDSSVAAALLVDQGYDVFGLTMITGCLSDWGLPGAGAADGIGRASQTGDAHEALEAAKTVAAQLGIAHYTVDLRREFAATVVRPFVDSYISGLTPNPCVWCNAAVKFGSLLKAALDRGAERFATGHYAAVEEVCLSDIGLDLPSERGSRPVLFRRSGGAKDQTYALCLLSQEQVRRCLLPLHGLSKPEVRAFARKRGLAAASRPESQDVCFLRGSDYRDFVARAAGTLVRPGPIVDSSGNVLGAHRGLLGFTVGQRRGLGIGGPQAYYVLELRPATNELVVGLEEELASPAMIARGPVFAAFEELTGPIEVDAAIRYRSPARPAVIRPLPGGRLEVRFRSPQRAVAPGQAVAFYFRDWLIGGACIARRA